MAHVSNNSSAATQKSSKFLIATPETRNATITPQKSSNILTNLSKKNITRDMAIVFRFDIDDTLVKTMHLIYNLFKDFVKNANPNLQQQLIGSKLSEFTNKFLDEYIGKIDKMVEGIAEIYESQGISNKLGVSPRARYDAEYENVDIIEGAVETLKLLRQLRAETGLNITVPGFSNNYMDNLNNFFNSRAQNKELRSNLDAVIAAERVDDLDSNSKPQFDKTGNKKTKPKYKSKPLTEAYMKGAEANSIPTSSEESINFDIGDRGTDGLFSKNFQDTEKGNVGGFIFIDTHSRKVIEKDNFPAGIPIDVVNNHQELQILIRQIVTKIYNLTQKVTN